MVHVPDPRLNPVKILDLRPTQITVGYREVAAKRQAWKAKARNAKAGGEFLGQHMIPAIVGPKKRLYIIDHHHLARALHDEGVAQVLVTIVADLRRLSHEAFWFNLDNRAWMHPYDDKGVRRDPADLPKTVADLVDDPYRSLAGELRHAGGFAKDTTPYSEFLWADFLRPRIKRALIKRDFAQALEDALTLVKSADADYLPGWCGPVAR